MDLYESLQKITDANIKKEASSYAEASRDFAEQGFDEDIVAELLQAAGCSLDTSKELASIACRTVPEDFIDEEPPASYQDVKATVQNTILTAPMDKISNYFKNYCLGSRSTIPTRIALARDAQSSMMIQEIHEELEPIVEDLILTNIALAPNREAAKPTEKETLEQDLFGVWPIGLVRKYAERQKAEKTFIRKANKSESFFKF